MKPFLKGIVDLMDPYSVGLEKGEIMQRGYFSTGRVSYHIGQGGKARSCMESTCCVLFIIHDLQPAPYNKQTVGKLRNWQKFGTSPVGMSWERKQMIPTQSQLFAIPSPDKPPLSF